MRLSETNIGDRVKLGISKEGRFIFHLTGAHRVIEVVVAGRQKAFPGQTYIAWENWVPEFVDGYSPDQSIRRIRRQQYEIPVKFRCGYHISDCVEVEMAQAAKQPSASSLPLLLACIGVGAALSTLSSQSTINNQYASRKAQN